MGDIKPWQLIVIVLGLLGAGFVAFTALRGGGVPTADSLLLIDIKTGDVYRADLSGKRGVVLPAKNPETGERTLVPLEQIDGEYRLGERYTDSPMLRDVSPVQGIDLSSGQITIDINTASAKPL